MKTSIILALGLLCLASTAIEAAKRPAPVVAAPGAVGAPAVIAPPPTLAQDLEELTVLVPTKMIFKMITRYLMNDAEFQAVVRTLNSYDAFMVRMRVRSQPEILMFQNWVRQQLMLSGGSMELEESMELNIFSMSPYWANSVYGWQGFLNEFMSYYPIDLLRAHINMKITQNGIFAQFWTRVQALKPVYERILAFPETQRLIASLQAAGVDTNQLDQIIRTQFDWLNLAAPPAAPAPGAGGVAGPAVSGPVAVQTPVLG